MDDDTPMRPSHSMTESPSGMSMDGQANELEALRSEFAAYKGKTKDWQSKVRERDNLMRTRLQEMNDIVASKQEELEALDKQVATLKQHRNDAHAVQCALEAAKLELLTLQNAHDESCSDVARLRNLVDELESETQRRTAETKHLRSLNSELEDNVAVLEWKQLGLHAVQMSRKDPTCIPGTALYCLDVAGVHHVYVVPQGQVPSCGSWLLQSNLPSNHRLEIPQPLDVTAEERCKQAAHDAASDARRESAVELERTVMEREARHNTEIQRLMAQLDSERQTAASSLTAANVRATNAEQSLTHEVERHQAEVASAVDAAKQASSQSYDDIVRKLKRDVAELEAYKARAQVAIRNAAQPPTVAPSENNESEKAALVAAYESRLAAAADARAAAESAATKREEELNRAWSARYDALQSACDTLQVELSQALAVPVAVQPTTPCMSTMGAQTDMEPVITQSPTTTIITTTSAPRDHEPRTVPTHSATTPLSTAAQPPMRSAPPPIEPIESLSTSSSDAFSMETMLNALDDQQHGRGGTWELERLRQQLHQQAAQLQKHRVELRDVALREKVLLEQDALLKEHIRDMERSAARTKDFTEHQDYLKNIVVKALTCRDVTIKKLLLPVVSEVLHLAPAERATLLSCCDAL